jgi:hypothetical protein
MWLDVVMHMCNLSFLGGKSRRTAILKPIWAKLGRLYIKNKIKTKLTRVWLKEQSIFLAYAQPLVQSSVTTMPKTTTYDVTMCP